MDFINSIFPFIGAIFVLLSVLKLRKEKISKGVDWRTVAFYTVWCLWGVFFYIYLGMYLSLLAYFLNTCIHGYWLYLIFKYRDKSKKDDCFPIGV